MTFDIDWFRTQCEKQNTHIIPELIHAIAVTESSLCPDTVRFEPNWRYLFDQEKFAYKLGITIATEKVMQSTSWGLMQIMGTVARELGYEGHLTRLTDPELNVKYGILKLQQLFRRYEETDEVISAYNQGSPRRAKDGKFVNQVYVDKVNRNLIRRSQDG